MCDEVSLVVAPAADGNPNTQSLFLAKEGLSTDAPLSFTLLGAETSQGSTPLAAVPGQLWAGHPGPLTPASHSNL